MAVVFGDIGTSPLYAFRETFAGAHPLTLDRLHIYGVLSLIFWSMMLVVTVKYIMILTRADNKGEGGSLALLALIARQIGREKRWTAGIFANNLFDEVYLKESGNGGEAFGLPTYIPNDPRLVGVSFRIAR